MLAKELRLNVKKKSRTQWSYSFFDVFVKHRFYKEPEHLTEKQPSLTLKSQS